MMLHVLTAGPALSIQDLGRAGQIAKGLSRGGAADRLALIEGAALLGQSPDCAALEMAGIGGTLRADSDIRIALTGAPMAAMIEDQPLVWNASHLLPAGQTLTIGAARAGMYGYLHVGGGFDTPVILNSRAVHLKEKLGGPTLSGSKLPVGRDASPNDVGQVLTVADRFNGGTVRIVESVQTHLFDPAECDRLERTAFTRDPAANRQGVKLAYDGAGFSTANQLSLVSDVIAPGDIQMTGEGAPYVLLAECQTTGGYPRIASVIPQDLPAIAQAQMGAPIRFRFIPLAEARALWQSNTEKVRHLRAECRPLLRDPSTIKDLLAYQLISGMIKGDEHDH